MTISTAELVTPMLPQFCPTTNHYRCSDGRYLLVTVATLDSLATLRKTLGIVVPLAKSQLPRRAEIFLADADAVVLDADENPANGLTPLTVVEGCTDFAEALHHCGYELVT
ncbi:DUF7572 family protein [Mycobacteroides abscessus]|uniref:DUF7572 family protein n=1 Tax=Mycobacteroides abscessus TaxID=36809 RepID=UPI0009C85495|nr:hypothetical protein [Mycobacteroides abscessus]SLG32523.1 Uncharacterised protein [Mycobacteroides abscessus subsp. abscessus]